MEAASYGDMKFITQFPSLPSRFPQIAISKEAQYFYVESDEVAGYTTDRFLHTHLQVSQ
jgi:hypothetical protein